MTASARLTLAFALASASPTLVLAQAAPPAAGQPGGEVVKLSEFEVTGASSANGYVACETMTGSRINTRIIDLPYSIVNLTHEFFQDFGVQILDENMTYIGGLTNISIGGGFSLRGFGSTSMLRDGFYRLGRYGLSNIQEVEVIRGPNAAIYGRSSPGGMINFISLSPKRLNQQTLTLSSGAYEQNRANLYLTGSIGRDRGTYYVIDLNQTSRGYPGGDSHIRNNEDFVAVEHDFDNGAHLKVSAEYFLQTQHAPQGSAPVISVARTPTPDNGAASTVIGYDTGLARFDPYGPRSELNRGSDTFEAVYDQRFNDVWSTRLGLYRFAARRWDYNQNTGWGTITIPAAGGPVTDTRGALPSRGEIMEDGGGFQEDVVAHYWLFGRAMENKTLLTVDLNDYYRWDPTWEYGPGTDPAIVAWTAAGSGRVVTLTPQAFNGKIDFLPSAPVAYFPYGYNTPNLALFAPGGNDITGGRSLNGGTLTRRRTTSLGGNLREQALFLGGKLIAYGGLRTDNVLFSQRDYTVAFASVGFGDKLAPGTGGANQPGGSVVRRYVHQNNPNAGFSYLVLPAGSGSDEGLRVYGSTSSAYFVDQTSRPVAIAAATYKPFTARGYDFGIKGSYLDQRLNFTLGGYYDKEFNVSVTDTVEVSPGTFVNVTEQDGDQLVRGWESDASWRATPELTVGESFGHVNAIYTNFGSAYPEAIGRSAQNVSPNNGSAYLKYNIDSGPLKGLYFNALVTYVSSTPTRAPNSGDTTAIVGGRSVVTGHTDLWKLRLPSFTLWNFGVHYRLPRFSRKWDQTVSVILNNAFDKYYLKIPTATAGDGRAFLIEYSVSHF